MLRVALLLSAVRTSAASDECTTIMQCPWPYDGPFPAAGDWRQAVHNGVTYYCCGSSSPTDGLMCTTEAACAASTTANSPPPPPLPPPGAGWCTHTMQCPWDTYDGPFSTDWCATYAPPGETATRYCCCGNTGPQTLMCTNAAACANPTYAPPGEAATTTTTTYGVKVGLTFAESLSAWSENQTAAVAKALLATCVAVGGVQMSDIYQNPPPPTVSAGSVKLEMALLFTTPAAQQAAATALGPVFASAAAAQQVLNAQCIGEGILPSTFGPSSCDGPFTVTAIDAAPTAATYECSATTGKCTEEAAAGAPASGALVAVGVTLFVMASLMVALQLMLRRRMMRSNASRLIETPGGGGGGGGGGFRGKELAGPPLGDAAGRGGGGGGVVVIEHNTQMTNI
jgi:hypothetical protein